MRPPLFLLPLGIIAYFITRPPIANAIVQKFAPIIRNAESAVNNFVQKGQTTISNTERGLQFIRDQEALRTRAYQDSAGYWTIGYGHKIVTGDGLNSQSVISAAQAENLLRQDVGRFVAGVRAQVRVPITQNQFDALVSLAFNIGLSALAGSTLLRKLNAGDIAGAANEFGRWIYAGGRTLAALVSRRAAEAAIFNGAHL